jgi:peptidoglycan hydrolase CwlO-like protein
MIIKKAVAGILTAGVLTLGGAGAAYAGTAASAQASASQGATAARPGGTWCQRAEGRLDALSKRRAGLEARIDKLQKRIAQAGAHHREDVAEKLQKRVDQLQKAKERVADRIKGIHERCDGRAASTTAAR